VQVDHGGVLAVVSHPDHEFPGVRARVGGELLAGVPQVVKVNALQADGGENGQPHTAAEVGVRERRAGRGSEDERRRRGKLGQVLTKIRRDQLGKVHVPHTGRRLGRPEGMASTVVVKLAGDLYRAGIQVVSAGCPSAASRDVSPCDTYMERGQHYYACLTESSAQSENFAVYTIGIGAVQPMAKVGVYPAFIKKRSADGGLLPDRY
jgi:hypothetical protein